jgi:uncharacterized linocin/CFP29 family protein
MDFILNGQGHGDVAALLLQHNCDVGCLRPFVGNDNRSYISVRSGRHDDKGQPILNNIVTNAPATLRKDEWILLDQQVMKVARNRLRAFADLRSAGLTYSVPNAMGHTVLQTQNQGDIGAAIISMDGIRVSESDRPHFDLVSLPLPIIHKDFFFSLRQIATSRNGGTPIDTTTAEICGRKVAEELESLTLGTGSTNSYGGGVIYGYTNYTNRLTRTITAPTAAGWIPHTLIQDILAMRQQLYNAFHYGPYMVYVAPAWDEYLDDDFSQAKGDNTLRERLRRINGIQDVRTVDRLTNFDIVVVEMNSDVVRAVIGFDVTTVQWPSHGGMQQNFKVMCCLVPQLRADQNNNTGINHGSV